MNIVTALHMYDSILPFLIPTVDKSNLLLFTE